ncbi:MAG: hypothetical protein E6J87_22600, partial [Deltaproteobacteria bacterium]
MAAGSSRSGGGGGSSPPMSVGRSRCSERRGGSGPSRRVGRASSGDGAGGTSGGAGSGGRLPMREARSTISSSPLSFFLSFFATARGYRGLDYLHSMGRIVYISRTRGELGRKKGGPPLGEGRLNAADDVIGTLSARVTELSKRVALLEAELQSAEKRIEIYEDHDSQIQDALSGALKAAYQIRQRAETAAEQILEQAREQRRMILSEIERLQDERDRRQDEIASGRRGGIAAVPSRPLSSDSAASELRAVASEALKGLFEEIVEDMRTAQGRTMPAPATRAPETPRAPETTREPARPKIPTVTREDIETAAPTYEAMARMRRSTVEQEDIGAPTPLDEAPVDEAPIAEAAPEMPPAPIEEVEEVAEAEEPLATDAMRPISEGPS